MQINVFQMDNWKKLLLKLTVKKKTTNKKTTTKNQKSAVLVLRTLHLFATSETYNSDCQKMSFRVQKTTLGQSTG